MTLFSLIVFSGDFQNDQKHGRGEMIYADQSTYLGEWVNDWVSDVTHLLWCVAE